MKSFKLSWIFVFVFCVTSFGSALLSETGRTSTYFTTGVTEFKCISTYDYAFWLNLSDTNEQIWIYNFTDNVVGACNDETYMSDGFCCPENMYCSKDNKCVMPESGIISCSDLLDRESCENSPSTIADGLFELFPVGSYGGICNSEGTFESYLAEDGSTLCSNITYCGCVWNDTAESCASSLIFETACGNEETRTSCEWVESSREDHCGDPQENIKITFKVSGNIENALCQDQTVEYPCSVSIQLPFFSWFSFVLAFLLIAGIYFISRNR